MWHRNVFITVTIVQTLWQDVRLHSHATTSQRQTENQVLSTEQVIYNKALINYHHFSGEICRSRCRNQVWDRVHGVKLCSNSGFLL